jgi:hypothetical protein
MVDDLDHIEIQKIKNLVELSLQQNNELPQTFNSINSINVPVNQEVAWELTRFKNKERVYKNPNLSDIHTKSALIQEELKKKKKQMKKRPLPAPKMNTHQSKVFDFSLNNFLKNC